MILYWFLYLARGLSLASSCLPRGLSLLCEAKASLLLNVLHRHRRVGDFCVSILQLVTISSLDCSILFYLKVNRFGFL